MRRIQPGAQRGSRDAIRVDGVDTPITLMPSPDNVYVISNMTYRPGAEITVSGGGEDTGVDPFDIRTRGVPTLTVPPDALTYTEDGDLLVSWDQAGSPPGTRIVFRAWSGGFSEHHVECWSDDTGQLTVPAADAVGLDDVFLARQTVGSGETELGCGTLTTFSRVDLTP